MTQAETAAAAASLRHALAEGRIPARLQAGTGTLLERLEKPVAVTLFGLSGSGKSSVANLLLGSQVIPAGVALPTLQISGGGTAACAGVLADGSRFSLPGFDTGALAARGAVFAEAQLPLPALNQISLLEISAPDAAALERAVPWAAGRTGIALWCTQDFTPAEQAAWARAPEQMKDGAFLLVTKADALAAQDRLAPAMAAVQDAASEHFNGILPLAALEAQAARAPDGTVDRDRLRRSGGQALISAIMHEVKLRRQAALDQAGVLLAKYAPAPAAAAPAEDTAAPPPPAALQAEPDAPLAAETPAPDRPAPVAEAPVAAADSAELQDAALSTDTRQAFDQALDYLSAQGRSMGQALQDGSGSSSSQLIRTALKSVQWLDSHFEEYGGNGGNALTEIRGAVSEAEDLIQLIQVEQDGTSLFDATSILLQLKRDMQAQLAA
ncbi:hypothetical protein K3725_21970 (plasmid) [Leisingera sp. S132]|uniref:hypothetical protein n=1 Tax=Leisingera sp. S132 TaxID=2867016 RepID=UPI0021A566F0|nr:hypothetical protein [Leisingera sp. S132]UWQ81806.1 hypothetical protein K3725_21970 [Leisingera sp. S132]